MQEAKRAGKLIKDRFGIDEVKHLMFYKKATDL